MATVFTEQEWPAEFLISEANGTLSRENVTLAPQTSGLKAGTVLGKITASGKYTEYDNAASDGSEVASAILLAETVESTVDQQVAVIDIQAEVQTSLLVWKTGLSAGDKTAGLADLLTRFIKAR